MKMKRGPKKMKGFMCGSPASTAECIRSAIVHQRRTSVNHLKYIRLRKQPPSFSFPLPSVKNEALVATSPPPISDHLFQVVVIRVSIHCHGCVAKLKQHLSKMEGVTSFSIDLDSKRVTVMGHVSPSGVLESISKVKKAEFWPS